MGHHGCIHCLGLGNARLPAEQIRMGEHINLAAEHTDPLKAWVGQSAVESQLFNRATVYMVPAVLRPQGQRMIKHPSAKALDL